MEPYMDKGLVSYEAWSSSIEQLRGQVEQSSHEVDEKDIAQIFKEAVKKRTPSEKFGIFFSGGVDSTLIAHVAKQFSKDFICYTVGLDNAKDINWSQRVAKELDLKHRFKIYSLGEAETLFEKTAFILGEQLDVVNLGVGAVVLGAIQLAKEEGISHFFSGLGSEEIFAGYRRHSKAEDINEACWEGLTSMYMRDFLRDQAIAQFTQSTFLTPFLDGDLILAAMGVPGDMKIKEGYKKHILRKAALELGLPRPFAFRPKKAAQYGSSFDKAMAKIARKKGFRYKREYLDYLREHK